jgi:hypothetical protein
LTDSGHVLGVFGASYTISTIDTLLASLLSDEDDYLAFIVNNEGMLISASIPGKAVVHNAQVDALNCSNIIIKDVSGLIETYATSQRSGWEVCRRHGTHS